MTDPNCPKCGDQGMIVVGTVDRVEWWGQMVDVPEYGYCDCPVGRALAKKEEEYVTYLESQMTARPPRPEDTDEIPF